MLPVLLLGCALFDTSATDQRILELTDGDQDGYSLADADCDDADPAVHPQAPEVVTYGGPVLHTPNFVPVFFANDDAPTVAALTDFDATIGSSSFWAANTAEYGVGPATCAAPIGLAEDAPGSIDDTAIQTKTSRFTAMMP